MSIIAPVKVRIDHHRFGHKGSTVLGIGRTVGVVEKMGEQRLVPLHLTLDGPCIGIEQQLGGVTAVPFLRLPRPVDAKAITLAGSEIGQIAVPAKTGYLRQIVSCFVTLFVE
jgi:hypothetical protein